MGIRASEEGLKRIHEAIKASNWLPNSRKWVDLVIKVNTPQVEHPEIDRDLGGFSPSSWRRFVENEGVSPQKFRWCCQALGLDPEEVRSPEESSPEPEEVYIQRPPLEDQCNHALQQPGALVRVRGPRQLGKTRLLCWLLAQARQRGDRTVFLDMRSADDRDQKDLTTWLQWFCRETARSLDLDPDMVTEAWDQDSTPKNNCGEFWLTNFLKPSDRPLVLALDNVDLLFDQSWAKDFFGLIRGWFDKAKTLNQWKKVRFILSYSTEVYIELEIHQSPFNVGHEARLPNFTTEQASQWAEQLELGLTASQVADLMRVTSGYPRLLELAWRELQEQAPDAVANLVAQAPTLQGIYRSHLNELYDLAQRATLGAAIAQMVASDEAVSLDLDTMRSLERLGLGQFVNQGIAWRCAMYRDFFEAYPIR